MTHIVNKNCRILMGDVGISRKLRDEGYIATICTIVGDDFVDLHITENHVKQLIETLKSYTEMELK